MSETLVKVESVSKKFCRDLKHSLLYGMKDLGNELLGRTLKRDRQLRKDEFWAVKDISFELKRGECLGLIGRNGAGKTTLLRILNGLIKPDKGQIEICGRVGALIALGAGFNPVLTGRENIYVNASVLGLTKQETDAKFEEIVEFAELGEFIDSPVRSYSSGMQVRLGFAVATALEPDVLILDEVLAVGDIGFRQKCYNTIMNLAEKCAVIFVSHSMPSIARVSSHVLLLVEGLEEYLGKDVSKGIESYNALFPTANKSKVGSDYIQVAKCKAHGVDTESATVNYQEDLLVEFEFTFIYEDVADSLFISFMDNESVLIGETLIELSDEAIKPGYTKHISLLIPNIIFSPGNYSITIVFSKSNDKSPKGNFIAQYRSITNFRVAGTKRITAAPLMLVNKKVTVNDC
jgi:lipopolysaccharide transport system ATP-binding protein